MTSHGILEQAVLSIKLGQEDAFEAAFATAKRIIADMPGFDSLTLSRGVERPDIYLLLVRWESLDDREIGFRGPPQYK
jgi:heme-degrading monooxygenase HmoA